ncbi:helix-turn-helix domain-containing protein [Yinghuangia aomiensis]|uniref:Helix-turn-helix domain-containing protein n=1 Tax=Yinghuangia aomiensis TaxID=676205 RepID=A0ABP9HTE9_9ACTN
MATTTIEHDALFEELRLYTVRDVMVLTGLGKTAVFELLRSGRLRSVREGRARRIPAAAIREYMSLLTKEAEGNVGRAA